MPTGVRILLPSFALVAQFGLECFPPKEDVAGSSPVKGVRFLNRNFDIILDGYSNLVTPDPIPNSEVKLVMFVFVLSLMGTHEAVYFYFF